MSEPPDESREPPSATDESDAPLTDPDALRPSETPTDPMVPLGGILRLVQTAAEKRATLRRDNRKRFAAMIQKHTRGDNSAPALQSALLQLRARSIAALIPDTMTVPEFLDTPGLELDQIKPILARIHQCQQCPVQGGACDSFPQRGTKPEYLPRRRVLEYTPCPRWTEFEYWRDLGHYGVWERYRLESLDTLKPRSGSEANAIAELKSYAADFTRRSENLILQGPSSVNKTRMLSALMRTLHVEHGVTGMHFWIYADFLHQLDGRRDADAVEHFHSRAGAFALTALDGIHQYRPSDQQRSEIDRFVASRYSAGRPWAITTEVPLGDLVEQLGPATIERLSVNAKRVVILERVEDHRTD